MSILSDRLKEIRESSGLTQAAFSVTIGVSPATYNAYETDRQFPRSDTVLEICKKYNVSADWLLGIDNAEVKPKYERVVDMIDELRDFFGAFVIQGECEYVIPGRKTGNPQKTDYVYIYFDDPEIVSYYKDWREMKKLLNKGTLTEDLFKQWEEGRKNILRKDFLNTVKLNTAERYAIADTLKNTQLDLSIWRDPDLYPNFLNEKEYFEVFEL